MAVQTDFCEISKPLDILLLCENKAWTVLMISLVMAYTITGCFFLQELPDQPADDDSPVQSSGKEDVCTCWIVQFRSRSCIPAIEVCPWQELRDVATPAARRASRFVTMTKSVPKKERPTAKVKPAESPKWPAHLPKPPPSPVPTTMGWTHAAVEMWKWSCTWFLASVIRA